MKKSYSSIVKLSTYTGSEEKCLAQTYFQKHIDAFFGAEILKEEYEPIRDYLDSGERIDGFRYTLILHLASRKNLTNLHSMCTIVRHLSDLLSIDFEVLDFGVEEPASLQE